MVVDVDCNSKLWSFELPSTKPLEIILHPTTKYSNWRPTLFSSSFYQITQRKLAQSHFNHLILNNNELLYTNITCLILYDCFLLDFSYIQDISQKQQIIFWCHGLNAHALVQAWTDKNLPFSRLGAIHSYLDPIVAQL